VRVGTNEHGGYVITPNDEHLAFAAKAAPTIWLCGRVGRRSGFSRELEAGTPRYSQRRRRLLQALRSSKRCSCLGSPCTCCISVSMLASYSSSVRPPSGANSRRLAIHSCHSLFSA